MLCAFFLKITSEPTGRMTRLLICQIEHTPQNVQDYHSAPRKGERTAGGRISFLFVSVPRHLGFSSGSMVKESDCQCRIRRRLGFDPWVGKIPRRKKWQPTPVFLPGKSHGQRGLVSYSPWGRKRARPNRATEHKHPIIQTY